MKVEVHVVTVTLGTTVGKLAGASAAELDTKIGHLKRTFSKAKLSDRKIEVYEVKEEGGPRG